MHVSALTVFVFFANGTALTMALAMLFLVLWQAPRETDNRLMAALFLVMVIWSGSIFTARLLHAAGGDARGAFYGTVLGSALTTFALFVLVTHYAGFWRRAWARALLAIGLLATVALGISLASGVAMRRRQQRQRLLEALVEAGDRRGVEQELEEYIETGGNEVQEDIGAYCAGIIGGLLVAPSYP
jgi:predicted short-subunit dehydrogenase-like oxidoreductase (DUF2520 family)